MEPHHDVAPEGGGSGDAGDLAHGAAVEVADPGGDGVVVAESDRPGVTKVGGGAGFDGGFEGEAED